MYYSQMELGAVASKLQLIFSCAKKTKDYRRLFFDLQILMHFEINKLKANIHLLMKEIKEALSICYALVNL